MRPFAFASALEKCRGDAGCCPPSDRIDDALDLLRHLRSDRSPSSDFPSPSAPPSVLFPDLVLGALHFDGISTHQNLFAMSCRYQPRIVSGLACRHVLQSLSRQAVSDRGQQSQLRRSKIFDKHFYIPGGVAAPPHQPTPARAPGVIAALF